MIRRRPTHLLLALLAIALAHADAFGFVDLTGGTRLVARDQTNPTADKITFKFVNDLALQAIAQSPLCPATSSLRLVTDDHTSVAQPLDCAGWTIAGPGFRYKDSPAGPGSLRKITLRPGRLIVTLKGAPYAADPVVGPAAFVETRLTVGSIDYCGRWAEPPGDQKRNLPDRILTLGPTAACQVDCGNSIVEGPEACDDGNAVEGDGCDSNCTVTACGNGVLTAGEDCDDGDLQSGDGCRSDCTLEVCGDGIPDAAEDCDDGNLDDGDCCSSLCAFEPAGSPCADDLDICTDDECNGAGACAHPANAASCDDGDGCTVDDACSGGSCGGELRPPWINEFDYDDFVAALDDRDEFIEIAGPAGTDLSGYQIFGVEGGSAGGPCFTPIFEPFSAVGEANLVATIPPGTVLGDDTGTGIGFYVACFTNTSINVVNLPACDDVLPGPRTYSNLENGHLLNTDETTCPEGILLLDPSDGLIDAVSYEGVVPSVGTYGPFFHVFPPYSAPRDEGWLTRVSIEKVTSTLERAQIASEWVDPSDVAGCVNQGGGTTPPPACPTLTSTPGTENPQQVLECGSASLAFLARSEGLLE
jgi:cysteine-rich repeat protein